MPPLGRMINQFYFIAVWRIKMKRLPEEFLVADRCIEIVFLNREINEVFLDVHRPTGAENWPAR